MNEITYGNPAAELKEIIEEISKAIKRSKNPALVINQLSAVLGKEPEQLITDDEKLHCIKNLLNMIIFVGDHTELFPNTESYSRFFYRMTETIVKLPESLYNADVDDIVDRLQLISDLLNQAIKRVPEQAANSYVAVLNELRERVTEDECLDTWLKEAIFAKIRDIEETLMYPGLESEKAFIAATEGLNLYIGVAAEKTTNARNKSFFSKIGKICVGITMAFVAGAGNGFGSAAGQHVFSTIAEHFPEPFQQTVPAGKSSLSLPSGTDQPENTGEHEHQHPASVGQE